MKVIKEELRGSKRTAERQSLDKANLVELIKHNSLKEIAKMYGVEISAVSHQLTFVMNQRQIGFKKDNINLQDEEYLIGLRKYALDNTWQDSPERNVMVENGLMEFQQEI